MAEQQCAKDAASRRAPVKATSGPGGSF